MGTTASESPVTDPRFASFSTDPRFRLPSKKHTRTKIDKRFSRMLKDDDFSNTATVDRYGRKLSSSGKKKALERLYLPENEDEDEDEDEDIAGVEVEDDEVVERELKRVEGSYDPARGGGFSSSSEDEDEDEDEDGGAEIEEEFPDMQAETATVEMGEISPRFAVVNLDWDNIKSTDLMAVFSSFVPTGGKIHKICIYASEFGKERMDREELEGPPKEIFARKEEEEISEADSEDSDDDESEERIKKDLQKADDGEEFDSSSLRKYQLERLRYYYAVVECSSSEVAQTIYEATDGTEYLSSANFFDLRFIPDGTEFDDKPGDECTAVPSGYRPIEFVTDALQHSKVKLTWDQNPEEASRKDAINRAFSGSRAQIGENDLRAYLGSDTESEDEDPVPDVVENGEEGVPAPKLSKKELQRQKMRAALGLADEPAPKAKKGAAPVGDMEITFSSGLSSSKKDSIFENEPIIEETTTERYVRMERERKSRRKERAKAKREGRDPDGEAEAVDGDNKDEAKEDLGFDDPFFAAEVTDQAKSSKPKAVRKEERLAKKAAKKASAAASEAEKASLSLLLAPDDATSTKEAQIEHFDINEIARAEKASKKKGKKSKERESKRGGLQEGFEMDVQDERFGKVWESHEFAIDPSHPRFKGTEGMKALLDEGRRRRGGEGDGDVDSGEKKGKKRKVDGDEGGGELSGLVEMLKKKARRSE